MRRPRWTHVVLSLAVIAALAVAVPAFGVSKSIKKAIKAEVAKQVANATGPAGAPGTPGANGTARAYATVPTCAAGADPVSCTVTKAKGVTSVTRLDTGRYCVDAPGIDRATTTAAVGVDWSNTASPEGNGAAMQADLTSIGCTGGKFGVVTERFAQPSADSDYANNVAFTIVIP